MSAWASGMGRGKPAGWRDGAWQASGMGRGRPVGWGVAGQWDGACLGLCRRSPGMSRLIIPKRVASEHCHYRDGPAAAGSAVSHLRHYRWRLSKREARHGGNPRAAATSLPPCVLWFFFPFSRLFFFFLHPTARNDSEILERRGEQRLSESLGGGGVVCCDLSLFMFGLFVFLSNPSTV